MIITSILLFILVFPLLWFLREKWIQRNRPPGPFRFPIVGNLVQLALRKDNKFIFEIFEELSLKYGPIFRFQAGSTAQVVLSDYEIIKKISNDPSDLWLDRKKDDWIMERSFGKPIGVFWAGGEFWKESRKFCLKTLNDFGLGKQQSRDSLIHEQLNILLEDTEKKHCPDGKIILEMDGYFEISVLNIIFGLVTGSHFCLKDKVAIETVKTMRKLIKYYSLAGDILQAFPNLRHIIPWLTGYGQERRILEPKLLAQFKEILDQRKKEGGHMESQRDFTDSFLQRMEKAKESPGSVESQVFSEENYVVTLADMFLAGTETTANSLGFGLLYMLLNPEIQKKVQDEIHTVIGDSRLPVYSDLQQMPYMEATLMELLRIAVLAPLDARCPNRDAVVNGYEIPKGTMVVCNIHQLLKDPRIWKNPEDFYPERFLTPDGKILQEAKAKMVAFGIGRRICIGEAIARSTLFIYLTTFLQRYNILPVPNEPLPKIEVTVGLTIAPKPFKLMLEFRHHQ